LTIYNLDSKQIEFSFNNKPLWVSLNPTLHSWTIENLVKRHRCDERKRKLALQIEQEGASVKINVSDTGSGIQKKIKVFSNPVLLQKNAVGIGFIVVKKNC
jgi:sensor histidine kinase regulating citrate/malate metabolism